MKLKTLSYIALGIAMPWLLSRVIDMDILLTAYILLPLIGSIHELLHLIAIKILRLDHRFIANGLFIGFYINTNSPKNIVIAASFPQITTIVLIVIYIVFNSYLALVLSIYHTALSLEDITKIFRYTLLYHNVSL